MQPAPRGTLAGILALSGCANYHERTYGNWLEHVGEPVRPAVPMSAQDAAGVSAEVVRLRTQAESLRMKIAAEPSRVRRIAYYQELADIGSRIVPLEQSLRNSGFEAPARPAPGTGQA